MATREFFKSHKSLGAWQKHLTCWLVFLVFGVLFWGVIKNSPQSGIYVEKSLLNDHEYDELTQALSSIPSGGFYTKKLGDIAAAAKTLSWVQSVAVRRDWNEGIVVQAKPRVAVANFGSEHLVDVEGVVFSPADSSILSDPRLVSLYGNKEQSYEIMDKLRHINRWFAPLEMSVKDVMLTPRQTWVIRFDSGLRVAAYYDRVDEKLFELSSILKEGSLPVPLQNIQSIDLRYKNGFSITQKNASFTDTAARTQ